MKEMIPFANAHVNQHTKNGIKGLWQIEENKTNRNLGSLQSNLSESSVFSILDIIRKAELDAFNIGIEYGKEIREKSIKSKITQLEANLERMSNENERLATILDNITKINNN